MKSIKATQGEKHIINRCKIFEDVIKLYEEGEIIREFPTFIQFKDEAAIDAGGVTREMYSAFWQSAYSLLCDGANIVVPIIHPQSDMAVLPAVGKVISHGYLASGFLPLRIALPTLISTLLGPHFDLPDCILLEALLDYISGNERKKLQSALTYQKSESNFPKILQGELISVLSRLGCRVVPTPKNITNIIVGVARYEFCCKPAAAVNAINMGIPEKHKKFWKDLGVNGIAHLYTCLNVTNDKVLSLLCYDCTSPIEERIMGYLVSLIGNLRTDDLQNFLRFVTGSSVCICSGISVTFVPSRQYPFAGTCGYSLELPTSFTNYDSFKMMWLSILQDTAEDWKWEMTES